MVFHLMSEHHPLFHVFISNDPLLLYKEQDLIPPLTIRYDSRYTLPRETDLLCHSIAGFGWELGHIEVNE